MYLTYGFFMCHDSAVAHDRATGAPANEIEITPEMIERGLIEFFDYDPEGNEAEEIVEKIFLSMLSVSKEKSRRSL